MANWNVPVDTDDEYQKLVIRMNPPRVTIDNSSSKDATLVKIDSANKHDSLLEVAQALTDLNLAIKRAYISTDGEWFMDVFYVVDQDGKKLIDTRLMEQLQQSLISKPCSLRPLHRSVTTESMDEHTSIELTGPDRPGLLSVIFAILADLKCNVVASEVWTHNSRMASVIHLTDEISGLPIKDSGRLAKIRNILLHVLEGHGDKNRARSNVSVGTTHTERRLHQMMYADRDYDCIYVQHGGEMASNRSLVTVENCIDKGYSVVNIRCKDRSKLLFDTVCTLTDMQYLVFHATLFAEASEAHQEYYIRHVDGCPVSSEAEKQRIIHCLEAAIKRRTSKGLRLELCSEDRVGILSKMTRIFRENGISVSRAEVTTIGSRAVNIFYVTDSEGNPIGSETVEAIRKAIGQLVLHFKDDSCSNPTPNFHENGRFSLVSFLGLKSEKFLCNLGLIRSDS